MYKTKVKDYFNIPFKKAGDVGVEIEIEAVDSLPLLDTNEFHTKGWRFDVDHSLKKNGMEFIMKEPVKYNKLKSSLSSLKLLFKKHGIEVDNSVRAGIHVHMNMQEDTIGDVFKFALCYYPMETVLTRFCGDGREGNLFCLRARDAEGIISYMQDAVEKDNFNKIKTDNLRYAALNYQSLFKYGSLESRALATTPGFLTKVQQWVNILHSIRDYSKKIVDVVDTVDEISGEGPRGWMENIVGKHNMKLLDYPEIEDDIMFDMRLVQFMAHQLQGKC